MAQLKSTSVTGNLSVTGNTVASSFIKHDGLETQFLMADGHVENAQNFNQNFVLNNTNILGVNQVTTKHLQLQSENFNDSNYDHIYVGNTNAIIKYRNVNQFRADLKLAQVYDYKDTLDTLDELKAITSAKVGDTYFITDSGESWSCKQKVTAATNDNYTAYWSNLGNAVDLSGYTTLNTNQTIDGQKTFTQVLRLVSDLLFTQGNKHLRWESGTNWQRIKTTSNSTGNDAVFEFQQSSNSGSSYSTLFTIKDNGQLIAGSNLQLTTTSSENDVSLDFKRGTSVADWKIINSGTNSGGGLYFQCNYYDDTKAQYSYKDALTILSNEQGVIIPSTLYLSKTEDIDASSKSNGALIIGDVDDTHLAIDTNKIMAKKLNPNDSTKYIASDLYLNNEGGLVHIGSGGLEITGSVANDSLNVKNGHIVASKGYLKSTMNENTVTIGSQNADWCHIYNSADIPFIFNKTVASTDGDLGVNNYPWKDIKFNGELQFFEDKTQRANFKYNISDKCIDVIFN